MSSGCGCKKVYRFPHTTYPYSSCICSFLQQHPYFLFMFFVLVYISSEGLDCLETKQGHSLNPISDIIDY